MVCSEPNGDSLHQRTGPQVTQHQKHLAAASNTPAGQKSRSLALRVSGRTVSKGRRRGEKQDVRIHCYEEQNEISTAQDKPRM